MNNWGRLRIVFGDRIGQNMSVFRKWYQLLVLIGALVIGDQFCKIAVRYFAPEKPHAPHSIQIGFSQKPGWIQRDATMPTKEAVKRLVLSANGLISLLVLLILFTVFQKNIHNVSTARAMMPYAFVSAAIMSLCLDNLGVWSSNSASIRWIHLLKPVPIDFSWAEVYVIAGLIMFLFRFRRNELLPPVV